MSEPISTWRKTVNLNCSTLEQALPIRTELDEKVYPAVQSLSAQESGLQITRQPDESGNTRILASAKGYEMEVNTRAGRDSVLQGGQSVSFVSYTIRAECRSLAFNRAATAAREIRFGLRAIGAIAFTGLFFLALELFMKKTGMTHVEIPIYLIIGVLLAGAGVGERIGSALGNFFENRALSRSDLPQWEGLWETLELRLAEVVQRYSEV